MWKITQPFPSDRIEDKTKGVFAEIRHFVRNHMDIQHKIMILVSMLWLHVADDYYLQGTLANLKQRSWWETNAPDPMYRHDYKAALIFHAFSWTCSIMLPAIILYFIGSINPQFFVLSACIIFNTVVHAIVDDLKANKKTINLIQDQLIHTIQIIITWIVCVLYA